MKSEEIKHINQLKQINKKLKIGMLNEIIEYINDDLFCIASLMWQVNKYSLDQHPEVQYHLISLFGCQLHADKNCESPLCKAKKIIVSDYMEKCYDVKFE